MPGRRTWVPLILLFSLAGFRQAPRIGPNGDGTLRTADDQGWSTLQAVTITADPVKGEYHARFSPRICKLDGRTVRIAGYMLPVEVGAEARHFVITRRSSGCPFCAPPDLTEAVEVHSRTPVRYSVEPVALEGRLHLAATTDTGLFYRLDEADLH